MVDLAFQTIIFPVRDLARAKEVYGGLLGVAPVMDEPYYVGYQVGAQHVGLDPHGHAKGLTTPLPYADVSDIHAAVGSLTAAGAEAVDEPKDVGGGKLVATLRDADGNVFGLAQPA